MRSSGRDSPLLGGLSNGGKSSIFSSLNISHRGLIIIAFIATSGITFFSISYLSLTLSVGKGEGPINGHVQREGPFNGHGQPGRRPPPSLPPPHFPPEYNLATCARLDSPFEYESPPDFTKLGLDSWTECREVKSKEGWRVEHCTAPGSTWSDPTGQEVLEDLDDSNRFLFRPEPRPEGQPYLYMTPPTPKHNNPRPPPTAHASTRDKASLCNPSGYFRVKRLFTPSSNYTLGSDNPNPELRCRNDPARPIAFNNITKDYIENHAGPDTFRAVLDGPEHFVANQQINLGDCTYALPYVLSRPGRFWLVNIEHGYEDFQSLNENFDESFAPKFHGDFILPEVQEAPPGEAGYQAYRDFKQAVSEVYQFTVCDKCLDVGPKYEDWPLCSIEPLKAFQEYGVLVRSRHIRQFEELSQSDLEFVGARPSCRHGPRLVSFEPPETVLASVAGKGPAPTTRPYGSPPPIPTTIEELTANHQQTKDCLGRNRAVFFGGDSHARQLLSGVANRFNGDRTDPAKFEGWNPHREQLGGVFIRQEFDQFFRNLPARAEFMLDENYTPFSHNPQELDLLENFDTLVFDYGAWAAGGFYIGKLMMSDEYAEFMKKTFWNLAEVRFRRQQYFKKTGYGYDDLVILWMGNIPWPDQRLTPDMRTNNRLQYWEDMINAEIVKINEHYKEHGGMIDSLNSFRKYLPFRKTSPDESHFTAKQPVDAVVQVMVHKMNLCRAPFTPQYPTPVIV